MMLTGRIYKGERYWVAECEAIGSITQGKSRTDACAMLADLIQVRAREELQRSKEFQATVVEIGETGPDAFDVHISSNEAAVLVALVLKNQRKQSGLSLAEVAEKLGAASRNAFANYEQGKREPSIGKFIELLAVVAPDMAITVGPRTPAKAPKRAARKG